MTDPTFSGLLGFQRQQILLSLEAIQVIQVDENSDDGLLVVTVRHSVYQFVVLALCYAEVAAFYFCDDSERARREVREILEARMGLTLPVYVSAACQGETCRCGKPAARKVGEEILFDDPCQVRHNFTAYVCWDCFCALMGPVAETQQGAK